ncbi:EndoU domain-containing protein [Actinoplanes teichomyceticus]|nr:EndoU domain-containing protein [Actinoplanes teichomyceticus]
MPAERLRHTLMGERDGRASGFHHRPNGVDPAGAKLIRVTKRDERTGVYEGQVAIANRRNGEWHLKQKSTFFPDDWTPEQVDNAVDRAFREGAVKDPRTGRWQSTFRGIVLEGFYDPDTDTLRHGYPVLGPRRTA